MNRHERRCVRAQLRQIGEAAELPSVLRRFRSVWAVDFEFQTDPITGRVWPVCMVAIEFYSGKELLLWRDQLLSLRDAPFDTGDDSLLLCFQAVAELSNFLELSWKLPRHICDLYAEHRTQTNGTNPPYGNGLLGALALRGLAHINAGEKEDMRQLVLRPSRSWSPDEIHAILQYCRTDVEALIALLPAMASAIQLSPALLRGRYGAAVARMEREGIPIDVRLYQAFMENWETFRPELIREADMCGVYEGTTFKMLLFANYLASRGILAGWQRTPTGLLATDDDTFLGQIELHRHQPFDRSSLTRWRQRLGEEHIVALLQESLSVAHRTGAIDTKDLERVAIDTTVQEKAIASRQKVPIDLPRQPHQRMRKLMISSRGRRNRSSCRSSRGWLIGSPTANLAVEGITNRPKRESQTARKPACSPGFLAKSITLLRSNHRDRSIAS